MADTLLTRNALAQRLQGLTPGKPLNPGSITRWVRDGCPVVRQGRGRPSLYSEREVRAWLHARDEEARRSGVVDLTAERARKERALAIEAEQRIAIRARQYLPAAEVEKVWTAEVAAVRAAILHTYTSAADRVHRAAVLEGVAGVQAVLRDIAHGLLRELASRKTESEAAS
jgi:phage terminase Nu1 subunit (DNA packaging protein)